MRKNIFTKIAAVAAATVLAVTALPALVSDTHAADDEYSYVYAGLTWQEYWANEGVYNAGDATASDEKDTHGEYDKGAFDTVTRATTNHGLHRGSYQCMAVIDTEDGKKYELAGWTSDGKQMILTDGTQLSYSKGTITNADGSTSKVASYEVTGIKYVPVKVKTSDLEDFKTKYTVVENGGDLLGGYGENKLQSYKYTAAVSKDTNGLKTAVKNADGTYSFSARQTGNGKSFKEQDIVNAADITTEVKEATGSYGEFLRVDINGDGYGALGAMMQAVKWTYYGNDSTRTNVVMTYGTKFAADNWMHKAMGIQLGLTDSARCQLPEGYDGTGYWSITVYALGYTDTTIDFEATEANIVKVKEPVSEDDKAKLSSAIAAADALNEADYTAESWAVMKLEYEEAVDALAIAEYKADVDDATEHLTAAINALVKVEAETPSEADNSDNTADEAGTEAGTSDASSSGTEVSNAEAAGNTDTSVSGVKTGDASNVMAYMAAAILAVTAGAVVTGRRKIKNIR